MTWLILEQDIRAVNSSSLTRADIFATDIAANKNTEPSECIIEKDLKLLEKADYLHFPKWRIWAPSQ